MAVLIDPPRWPAHGTLWSHLVSDTSVEELHAFARAAGLPARGFEGDHYDVPRERFDELVAAGARPVSSVELHRALQVSGLRRRKRRGEKVIASLVRPDGGRLDSVLSPLDPVLPAHAVQVIRRRGELIWVCPGPATDAATGAAAAADAETGDGGVPLRMPVVPFSAWLTRVGPMTRLGYLRWVAPAGGSVRSELVVLVDGDVEPDGHGSWIPLAQAVQETWSPLAAFLERLDLLFGADSPRSSGGNCTSERIIGGREA